ncbi:MAG: hypothetical protein IJD11_03690, partial [Oscillospiraceae bacterium]|nr:hypothetical protein [Oscillospiraceae bacterium]
STAEDDIETALADHFINREDAEFMYEMGKNMEYICTMDSAVDLDGGTFVWKMYQPVLRNTKTPAAVIEETDGIVQTAIDASLNDSEEATDTEGASDTQKTE